MEQMRTHRSKRLQTYPPDDLVLDDLIAGLQSEYGVPPTPQEYRLVIRTPSAEAEAEAADAIGEDAADAEETPAPAGTQMSASSRRRRRRRSASPRGPGPDETGGRPDQAAGDPEAGSDPG